MNNMLKTLGVMTLIFALSPSNAFALAEPWQMGMQEAASPVQEDIQELYDLLLYICIAIVAFVSILLAYVMIKFNAKSNPVPSKTTHNVKLEVAWTLAPIIILVIIVIPSMKLLYFADKVEDADMTLKVKGHQWYWEYTYPDHDDLNFTSYMIPEDDLKEGEVRLLETDNKIVLPINKKIRLLVTAGDVLHSWAMPSFGVKLDAVPGRFNETWFEITKEGTYYGQCSEICGTGHGFMPIQIKAVSEEEFNAWVETAKEEFSSLENNNKINSIDFAYNMGTK